MNCSHGSCMIGEYTCEPLLCFTNIIMDYASAYCNLHVSKFIVEKWFLWFLPLFVLNTAFTLLLAKVSELSPRDRYECALRSLCSCASLHALMCSFFNLHARRSGLGPNSPRLLCSQVPS